MSRSEFAVIGKLAPASAEKLVQDLILPDAADDPLAAFARQPVRVLFGPSSRDTSSLHYMFFPPSTLQPFHCHPGSRTLLIVCASTMRADICHGNNTPADGHDRIILDPGQVGVLRIAPDTWHRFETMEDGCGAIAYTFHPADEIVDGMSPHDLMERLTKFWEGDVTDSDP